MTVAVTGIGVSTGHSTAIGKAYLVNRRPGRVDPGWIQSNKIEQETKRFFQAVSTAVQQLQAIRQQIPDDTPSDIVEFIDTHLLMLEDKAISEAPAEIIRQEGCSAEWALQLRRDALVKVFENMADPYLRTRKDDLDHVINRIQSILQGNQDNSAIQLKGRIVLAEDLTPADTILLRHKGIAGFVTEFGGPNSHTAILARSLGIPAVVGAHGATTCLRHDDLIILDAISGVAMADCDEGSVAYFRQRLRLEDEHIQSMRLLLNEAARTRDGLDIELHANIELPEDVTTAQENGATGIGLYRTEFIYMNRPSSPTEEEHFSAYKHVVTGMGGDPVTIRTLDLGADKQAQLELPTTPSGNPALGLRAVRLCLKEPELFRPQLRAILRASAFGPTRIMIPMLTNVWEALQVRAIIEDVMHELTHEGQAFDPDIAIGGTIEVPAAALSAASFAEHLDFLSIGTNDLIQYTLAIDRIDDEVNHLYDPLHPAVLKLIKLVIDAGREHNIPISMCGEMAGNTKYIPLLIGLGLEIFSMQPGSLLDAKQIIRTLDAAALQERVTQLFPQLDLIDSTDLLKQLENI